MIANPVLKLYGDRPYCGIRFVAPYRGMFAMVDERIKELNKWISERKECVFGPRFLRYRVIDMQGEMELEVGSFCECLPELQGAVACGVMPGGRYATLTYSGLGLAANKQLLGWIDDEGYQSDRMSVATGDAFACRYEAYLTDPKVEPRKKRWQIELAIKLKD